MKRIEVVHAARTVHNLFHKGNKLKVVVGRGKPTERSLS